MHPLFSTVVIALVLCSVTAHELPAKFVADDGPLALFLYDLDGDLTAHIMLGYGLIVPLDAQLEGDTLLGSMGDGVDVEGVLDGDVIHLVLRREGVEEELSLTRQVAPATRERESPLLAMLALVPDLVVARDGGIPGLSFADYGAALRVDGVERPRTREEFGELSEEALTSWMTAVRRVMTGPSELREYAFPMIESLPELLGFEWFAIERALSYGRPPSISTVLAVDVDAAHLAERLAERAFAEAALDGVTVWHRQEDGRMDIASREPADPFVGALGLPARVSVLPGHLANSRTWPMARAVVGTFRGQYPSLADSPDFRTLAEALDESEGVLIQVQFLGPLDAGFVDDPFRILSERALPPVREGPMLEPFGLAALADGQEGQDQVATIALLYEGEEAAERAAAVLVERLASFHPEVLETWGARIDPPRVYTGAGGVAAAIASLRYPLPAADAEVATPGGALLMWLRALVRREFDVLRIGP